MATRGIRVLITLPVLTAILVAGFVWLSAHSNSGELLFMPPDQVTLKFLRALNTGQAAAAAGALAPDKRNADLLQTGRHFRVQFGTPIISTARISERSANRVTVWSETTTNLGHHYLINWTLERHGHRWFITDVGNLREMLPDTAGL